MQSVYIKFLTEADRARGFFEISPRHSRVSSTCLAKSIRYPTRRCSFSTRTESSIGEPRMRR